MSFVVTSSQTQTKHFPFPGYAGSGATLGRPTPVTLPTASTHVNPDPVRSRKLLLNAEEIRRLVGKVEQRGYTLVPLDLHYSKGRVKLQVGLAKGKKQFDKRATLKEREWNREQHRLLRTRAGTGRA